MTTHERLNDWNKVYKIKGKLQYTKDPLVEEAISLFKKNNAKKILDLGCGTGRHLEIFTKNGFRSVGVDIAEVAVNIGEETMNNVHVVVTAGNMTDIMYPNNYFDGVFCFQVIHHAKVFEVFTAAFEIQRVLKKDGSIFITFPSTENEHIFKNAKEIEPNTYINLDIVDGMVPHHFFTKEEITKLLKNFKILKMYEKDVLVEHEHCSWNYWIVSAKKL